MKSLLSSASLVLFGSASMAPAAIVLVNSSFESPDIANGNYLQGTGANFTGWAGSSGTAATFLVDNNTTQNAYFNQAVPNGQQAMSLGNGGYITQELVDSVNGAVLTGTVGQQFDISFYAARRSGGSGLGSGTFSVLLQAYNGSGGYVGDLASQMFQLASDGSGSTIDLGLAAGQWSTPINLSLTAPANLFAGNRIRVVFANNAPYGNGGGNLEAAIDNVSVVAIPEPSAALLGGLGMLALLRRRR